MRNFRTAAIAAATSATVAFSGATVATAADAEAPATEKYPTLSSKVGEKTDAGTPVKGVDLLGTEVNDAANPEWAKIWRDATYAGLAVGVLGAIIGMYNYAVYNNIIPQHFLDPMFNR